VKNAEIARMFQAMADVMEIKGENPFRVNSYRNAARVISDLAEDVAAVAARGELTGLPGVGEGTAGKIEQYLAEGRMDAYEELTEGFPVGVLELLRIPGMGPKTVAKLMDERDVRSLDDLEKALQGGELEDVPGMRAKTIRKIRAGLDLVRRSQGRTLLGEALPLAHEVIEGLRARVKLDGAEAAGSLRRRKETVGDIDILVNSRAGDAEGVIEAFAGLDCASEVLAAGGTRGSIRTGQGLQVDLRVVPPESWGAALVYFTGSKAHNVKIRGLAHERGLKINEYGVFRGEERVAGATEEDVYATLGLPWIPPELREDRGEVEAAAAGALPGLIGPEDVLGDLHAHTNYSDGVLAPLDMARAAKAYGYRYIALTDHSKNLRIAGGLTEERLARRNDEIDAARAALKGFTILKGTEVDILKDGSLDYSDEVLAALDWVVASVHDHFGMSEKDMTERIVRAARSPHVDCIGHLTGRLIGTREGYAVDASAVLAACAETGTCLELNAQPDRLDITDLVCREAAQAGVKVALGSDAHSAESLRLMQFGIATARRGWLGPEDAINHLTAARLRKFLASRKG